ncbi:hypothetical protein JM946_13655 [Steroidobacter sp. S1-65]|uniref:Uncharacterized protein n=1 Tax=Steroidobacter gossypii TaxID=2805490 RepID=A0ABS1WXT1_9GAMM|nr:hypothetical protein [Steroidobacter gossypii]MBM0105781.1 hypothetical protein [Steroidobacter gossypii]
MSNKIYLPLERGACVVCGQSFEAGTLVVERDLIAGRSVAGWELCATDARMHRQGFVALVECDLDMSVHRSGDPLPLQEVQRTGPVMHLTRETFVSIFKTDTRPALPCAYVPRGTLQKVAEILQRDLN